MRYLPIHIDLKDQNVVVFGGEGAAEAKLRTLIKTEARIHVIAPHANTEITRWAEQGLVTLTFREWQAEDFDAARLIYAATEDKGLNARLADLAREKHVLANAADDKEACDFITPALVDRSPVIVSIGTEGTSPSLGRAIKTHLEALLPTGLGVLSRKINLLRSRVALKFPALAERQRFWADVFDVTDLATQLKRSPEELEAYVNASLKNTKAEKVGHVALVGAGPGNPDLLTLAARQHLHSADVIVYDRLVSQGVLDFGRREAEYIYVGKEPGGHSTPQDDINAILIEKARTGAFVVRLKSGDPLIFGRADEELDTLEQAGIAFSVVPGITAAASAAAEIGASLTTRGKNKAVALMTGHDAKGFAEHDWKGLAQNGSRAAIYMGVGAARFIQGRLMLHGAAPNLPVTVVENASRPDQVIVSTTLALLPQDIEKHKLKGPAILLVGYRSRHEHAGEITLSEAMK